jgi:hypothetical protein
MMERMVADGYVVIAPFWQTYSNSPSDAEVESLKGAAYLISYLPQMYTKRPSILSLRQ